MFNRLICQVYYKRHIYHGEFFLFLGERFWLFLYLTRYTFVHQINENAFKYVIINLCLIIISLCLIYGLQRNLMVSLKLLSYFLNIKKLIFKTLNKQYQV